MENKVVQYRYGAVLSVVPAKPTLEGDLFGRTILARDKDEALDYFAEQYPHCYIHFVDQIRHWENVEEMVEAWEQWNDARAEG